MQPSVQLFTILTAVISLLIQQSETYTRDVVKRMREKVIYMDWELVIDAFAKVQSIDELKFRESKTTAYRQGELAYHVRKKWSMMRRLYFSCMANKDSMTTTEIIHDMTRLQRLNMDIYHMTENMDEMEEEDTVSPRGDMRRRLVAAHAALREQQRRRNDRLLKTYLTSKPPNDDFLQGLEFLNKNWTELLIRKKMVGNTFELDPDFIL